MEQVLAALAMWISEIIDSSLDKKLKEVIPSAIKEASEPLTMDSKRVMKELNIKSHSKLKTLRDNGTLSYIQTGTHITYPTESIKKYLEEHTIRGQY